MKGTIILRGFQRFDLGTIKPTIFSGLIFCIFVMCNTQSENSCDIALISVKLPKFVYSQYIGSWVIFGFLRTYHKSLVLKPMVP